MSLERGTFFLARHFFSDGCYFPTLELIFSHWSKGLFSLPDVFFFPVDVLSPQTFCPASRSVTRRFVLPDVFSPGRFVPLDVFSPYGHRHPPYKGRGERCDESHSQCPLVLWRPNQVYLAVVDSSFRRDSHQGDGRSVAMPSTQCSGFVAEGRANDQPMNQSAESWPVVGQCKSSLYQCKHRRRLLMRMTALQGSTYSPYKRL